MNRASARTDSTCADAQWLTDYVNLFNAPRPNSTALQHLLADDYRFEDPFHQIHGRDALAHYLRRSHENLGGMRFEPLGHAFDGEVWLLRWRFSARLRGKPWVFEGVSALKLDDDGRIAHHRDFWDSALFYQRLPLIGTLLHWVQQRLRAQLESLPR